MPLRRPKIGQPPSLQLPDTMEEMPKSSIAPASDAEERVLPAAQPPVRPNPDSGLWGQLVALVRYLIQSEVHTYAFSVAACALLSFFPFIVMMYTVAQHVFHSPGMSRVIGDMIVFFLP